MVGAGFGLQLMTAGLLMQSFGAYVVLLHDEESWSKTALSFAYSLQQITSGVMAPAQGALIDKLGPRSMMRAGIVIFGLSFMLFSQVQSLPLFYVSVTLLAFGAQMSGFFPVTVAIVNWFERRRARALSTMSIGFGLGGVLVPLVAYSLETFGWRATSFASGIIVIVAGLPLSQIMRHRPEDYGEVVDGNREAERRAEDRKSVV